MGVPVETLSVTLNGHALVGLSALDIPDTVELATVRRGATGGMLASATSKHGGPVSIMLQPGAPSLSFLEQQMKVIVGGGIVNWEGSVKDAKHEKKVREKKWEGTMSAWDYKIRKLEIAWELASRIIPEAPQPSGVWTEADYIARAQKVMKEAADAVDAVFKDSGGIGISV